MNRLVEEIIKPILEANSKIKKVVGIYGGRFQPFGPHHLKTYKWLDRQGKNVRGFFVVKKVININTIQIGKQKPEPKEFNNYELKWMKDKVWLWASMGYAKNRTDKGIKDIIVR